MHVNPLKTTKNIQLKVTKANSLHKKEIMRIVKKNLKSLIRVQKPHGSC